MRMLGHFCLICLALALPWDAYAQSRPLAIGGPGDGTTHGGLRVEALDQYGGLIGSPCTNTTGHFTLSKVNDRWWFCDPDGNVFTSMNVGNTIADSNGTLDCNGVNVYPALESKYGGGNDWVYSWAWETLRRMQSWGFNSLGQDSVGQAEPFYTCGSDKSCPWPGGVQPISMPYIFEDRPALYASINRSGYAAGAMKDIMNGVNSNYSSYRAMVPDVFDANLGQWWSGELANNQDPYVTTNYAWILGVFTDDSDNFLGSGAGPDFSTYPSGYNTVSIGYLTAIASPTQTYQPTTRYSVNPIYKDVKVYSKAEATSPATACSVTNPCSLRDYLWQKYGSISALNTAWSSNYTSFDSTGMQVKGESIGSGNGTSKVFAHTLAHKPASPNSVLVLVGSTAQAGDCAWFNAACKATSNMGSIASQSANYITQSASSINYSTGRVTITFVNPPAKGSAITVNYIYGGWMGGGTGLMDESGSNTWMGTNAVCLETSTSLYTVCGKGLSGGVPDAGPQVGADLDTWTSQMSASYFKAMQSGLAKYSALPYLGLDTIGSWSAPASKWFLEGAAPYINAAFVQLYGDKPSAAQSASMYSYTTRYLGDVPLLDFLTLNAEPDSSESCYPLPNAYPTQQSRGQEYLTTVQTFLTTPSYNGDYPWVGFDWWAWQDFQNSNQGLVSVHDNAYDGVEAVIARGVDPWGYPTGGETANYGDALTLVQEGNALWLGPLP